MTADSITRSRHGHPDRRGVAPVLRRMAGWLHSLFRVEAPGAAAALPESGVPELEKELIYEVRRASRYRRRLSILLLEWDRRSPSPRGQHGGDRKEHGRWLRSWVRTSDLVCAAGSQRLAVLLPETGSDGALRVGERLRRRAREERRRGAGEAHTSRIGAATFPDEGDTPASLLEAAEIALREAHRSGGDCVRRYGRLCKAAGSDIGIQPPSADSAIPHLSAPELRR